MRTHTVLIADDHKLFVEGIRGLLEPEFQVLGSVEGGRQLLEKALEQHPDVVLIDISMPGLNGIDAMRQLRKAGCTSKLVILTMHAEPEFVSEAMDADADGYVLKSSDPEEMLQALRETLLGRRYVAAQVRQKMLEGRHGRLDGDAPSAKLTPREREVLQLIAEGMSLKEIAAVLKISTRTVEYHRYNLTDKLGLKTVAELARYAARRGLVAP